VKRLEILDELLTRDVPTIVVRQEIERRRVVFRVTLEEDTEVRVADAAEHEARHVAGSYCALPSRLPPEQPSDDGADELAGVSGLLAKQGRAEESVAPACA
jgi:hypothetical protein